jgi:hypothetical protein
MMKFLAPLTILALIACDSQQQRRTNNDTSELTAFVLEEGDRISNQAQMALGGQLKQAIAAGGPSHAVQFCNLSAAHILDTLSTGYEQVKVKRTTEKLRNPGNGPSHIERELLQAYQQKLQDKMALSPEVTPIGNTKFLYSKPIIINNALCLNCHGSTEHNISKETLEVISNYYPKDQAVNYRMGDLRGIWSIEFDREELLKLIY